MNGGEEMNKLLIKTVMVIALVFGLGAVSQSNAQIVDITDPLNPVDRFFDIHLVSNLEFQSTKANSYHPLIEYFANPDRQINLIIVRQ